MGIYNWCHIEMESCIDESAATTTLYGKDDTNIIDEDTNSNLPENSKDNLKPSEALNREEETEDEDDEEEVRQFFSLMNKAERRNQRKLMQKKNRFNGVKSDWRRPELGDPNEDTTDTEDEDDTQETRRFLGLMQAAGRKKIQQKPKSNMVNVQWRDGKVCVTNLPSNIKIQRVPAGEEDMRRKEDLLIQRRKEMARRQKEIVAPSPGGKRKFGDRMTLTEAKVDDFNDTKDYVDYIQTKLQGVKIKLIK